MKNAQKESLQIQTLFQKKLTSDDQKAIYKKSYELMNKHMHMPFCSVSSFQ
jgi:hypothetical protein